MYHCNARLNLKYFALALLAAFVLASAVSAQKQPFVFPKRPVIKKGTPASMNEQALAAIGASKSEKRPTLRDMLSSKETPHKRWLGMHAGEGETIGLPDIDPDGLKTIPYWRDKFTYQGLTYEYTMVGSHPGQAGKTTTIPTVLIPIRFVFEEGEVLDASADLIDGQTPIQGIINSPIFRPHEFQVGGVSVGKTQYGDAFQRANFWGELNGSGDYHVLLGQPTVAPAFEVFVPAHLGDAFADFDTGAPVGVIYDFLLIEATKNAIRQAGVSTEALPIVVWGNVAGTGAGGIHGVYETEGGVHTYIGAGYHPRTPMYGGQFDVYILSHELLEWLNDPFLNNYTPGWNFPGVDYPRCLSILESNDKLEVSDVLEYIPESSVSVDTDTGTYRLADAAFLDFFTRFSPSRSANGQYTFFGYTNSPSAPCTGHVEVEMKRFEVPGAARTVLFGINNKGWVVGLFDDASNRRHGFLYDGRSFTQIDYPGAVATTAYKLNEAGEVVGEYTDAAGQPHGFSYKEGRYAPVNFQGSSDTVARGINSRGEIVGTSGATQEITYGFINRGEQGQILPTPFGLQSEASAINDSGAGVGWAYDDPNGPFVSGFIFADGAYTRFDFPGAELTAPRTVNNFGMHGGRFFDPYLGPGGYVTIHGYPREVFGNVFGMNDRGQIVGNVFDFASGRAVGYVGTLPK